MLESQTSPLLTSEQIAERIADAADTARRLPPDFVQGYCNPWPEIQRRSRAERLSWDELSPSLPEHPSPETIEQMFEVSRWMTLMPVDMRKVLWARGIWG